MYAYTFPISIQSSNVMHMHYLIRVCAFFCRKPRPFQTTLTAAEVRETSALLCKCRVNRRPSVGTKVTTKMIQFLTLLADEMLVSINRSGKNVSFFFFTFGLKCGSVNNTEHYGRMRFKFIVCYLFLIG